MHSPGRDCKAPHVLFSGPAPAAALCLPAPLAAVLRCASRQARDDLGIAAQLQPELAGECERELRRLAAREAQAAQKQRRELKSFFDR